MVALWWGANDMAGVKLSSGGEQRIASQWGASSIRLWVRESHRAERGAQEAVRWGVNCSRAESLQQLKNKKSSVITARGG